MVRLRVLAWSLVGMALQSHAVARAQTLGQALVNEAKAHAVLAGDAIRLQLPLSAPAGNASHATVGLLAPDGTKSGETTIAFAQGARALSATLPWPVDAKGKPATEIGWYRVAYAIDAGNGPAQRGVLSLGAIADNLLSLRLALPERLVAGKPLAVRVYAGNPVTLKTLRGVRLEGTLRYDDPAGGSATSPTAPPTASPAQRAASASVVRQAVTGATGEAILTYPIRGVPGESATLTVRGTLTGPNGERVATTLTSDVELSDRTTIHLDTDKPLHKPGETVHLRALIFDDAGHAAARTALTLTVKDPQNKTLLETPLTTDRFGIASYDWKTGAQLAPGNYSVQVELDATSHLSGNGFLSVRIRRYDLPEFAVSAATDHGFYLDGQSPSVHIHAGYLFGKPVSAGTVRIARADRLGWPRLAKTADKDEQSALLNAQGDAGLHLNVQSDFGDFKKNEYERFRDLQYRAIVTDASTGRSEPRNFTVRLTRYPVHIYLHRMGGDAHEGDYIVSATYADGEPARCTLTLDWMGDAEHSKRAASVSSNRYGLARVHLRYPAAGGDKSPFALRVTALDPEGRTSLFDDRLNAEDAGSIWFTVAHSMLKPGQAIEATVHGVPGTTVDIDVSSALGPLAHQQIHMTHAVEPLLIPADERFHGVVTVQGYTLGGDVQPSNYNYWSNPNGHKAVLYPEDRELKLKLSGLQTSYLPGGAVQASFDLRAADATAAPGALGVAVIDTAVEQRYATEEDANDLWFGWNWWQQDSIVSGITGEILNKTDMSQPVPEDLELAAEAMLQTTAWEQVKFEYDDENGVRNEFSSSMMTQLKPVGDAVLAARPERLPATLDAVRAMVPAAILEGSPLLDPWSTPYRVETAEVWNQDVLRMLSAGPDKRFGTGDDFSLDVAQRSVFALAGERLVKLLQDAVSAGQPLPATAAALKQFARAAGFDLDAVIDSAGKPYLYQIYVYRRFYTVQVYRSQGTGEQNGQLSGPVIWWSNPAIDFFSYTEARMSEALNAWAAAGRVFPATDSEARQAFAAAGIDVDTLRDPLGQRLELNVTRVAAYARVQQVKAGAALEAKSTPVTQSYIAIQVVRPADAKGTAARDVVTQFLHPVTEQSGSDLTPKPVDRGTFKANTGAIGGTVTDPSGAVIPGATVTVTTAAGVAVGTFKSLADGTFLVPDLQSGLYTVEVAAPGFNGFVAREVHVSAVSLTTVDVQLRVGAMSEMVQVNATSVTINASSAALGMAAAPGFSGTRAKAETGGAPGQTGKASISEATFTPRLRHVFEETAFWTPAVETNASGHASIHFNLPDSLTTWKLHALASTVDGRVGVLDQTFKTFQPFFVDLDVPQVLTVGDELTLPATLRNYTARRLDLPVTAKPADWLTLLTAATVHASVPANGSEAAIFGFRADKAVDAGPLRVTAAGARDGDAVERTVRVHPDGEPRAVSTAALLRKASELASGSTTLGLDLPANAIPGSTHAELLLYPNLGAHVLHAMKAVLERPYGCGEQTISSTYPSLLYLELLKASRPDGANDQAPEPPVAVEARTYLQLGYDRLLDYFDASGGLTYWGGNDHDADPALTAYGIEFLSEAQLFLAVDQGRITQAIGWLLTNQQVDGSWKPHYGATTAQLNLYIAEVLAQAPLEKNAPKELQDRIRTAVARATAWAASSVAAVHDPSANALRLRLAEAAHDSTTVSRLRAELTSTAVRSGNGVHWSAAGYSPFYGWGSAGEMEATAQVLSALRLGRPSPGDAALADDALFFLLRSQDRYGIWYSGQATVRVLQALLPVAIQQMKQPPGAQEVHLAINGVAVRGADAEALRSDPHLLAAPRLLDITSMLQPGHNELVFTGSGTSSLASAEATASFYVPWQGSPAPNKTVTSSDAGLDFHYACAATNAQAGKAIDCTVDARRFGSAGGGMLLAEVGLPPGAEVDRASLAVLLDGGTISRYELQPDRVVFYLWTWRAEGVHFGFRLTPRYAVHAKAAPATLSDYYNPDLHVVLPPQTFSVAGRAQR